MRRSVEATTTLAALAILLCGASPLVAYRIDGDGIDASLTGQPGDPVRGRQIVADRQLGTCLLCHSGPFPEPHLQGNIAPPLDGVGSRLIASQIRLRLVDSGKLNPNTIMPAYYVVDGLNRVGRPWQGRPLLDQGQIEDVVAFLMTLRSP
jgi:sulfur-oxidizing protein SoxX